VIFTILSYSCAKSSLFVGTKVLGTIFQMNIISRIEYVYPIHCHFPLLVKREFRLCRLALRMHQYSQTWNMRMHCVLLLFFVFLRTRRRSARHRIKKREKRPKAEYNAEAKGEENTPPNAAQHAAAPNQATLILSYTHAYKPTKISTHLRPNVGRPALRCTGGWTHVHSSQATASAQRVR
jgi:hypothetical protein